MQCCSNHEIVSDSFARVSLKLAVMLLHFTAVLYKQYVLLVSVLPPCYNEEEGCSADCGGGESQPKLSDVGSFFREKGVITLDVNNAKRYYIEIVDYH